MRRVPWLVAAACVVVLSAALVVRLQPKETSAEPLSGGAVPVPEKVYLGAYDRPTPGPEVAGPQNARAADALGRPLVIDGHYHEFRGVFPSAAERADAAAGQIPLINWQPNGITMADIGAGRYDDLIRARADGVKAFGRPVLLRFAHEMNGDWYSWSPPAPEGRDLGNTVADYVAAWRHIHQIFEAAGVSNVSWVWCPNAISYPADNGPMQYYPGDQYVDWIGVDAYNFGAGERSTWLTFSGVFAPIYHLLPDNKPVIVAEFGSAEAGGSKADWIADAATRLTTEFTRVHAVVFFDQGEFSITSSPAALAAARKMAEDPLFSAAPQ